MPFVIFVAPFFTGSAVRMIEAVAELPDVRCGLISQDPEDHLAAPVRDKLAGHWRVENALDTAQILHAAQTLQAHFGPIQRLFGAAEHLQLQLAEVREALGVRGLSREAAWNFRDKSRMKSLLRSAGLPCAKHRLVEDEAGAWDFAREIGYPLVLKPPSGAGAQATVRVDGPDQLRDALAAPNPSADQPLLVEEFILGDEHSFETISLDGKPLFHSLMRYYPSPLEVLQQPWIQWRMVLPREIDEPVYDDIRSVAFRALETLGMGTGMSHMEWFRRRDGSIAISEVAARPPGAQMTTVIGRAHDVDIVRAWTRLMIFDQFDPPARRFAAGIAFLRGQGSGRVVAIHGLDEAQRELGELVTDAKLPAIGQAPSSGYEGDGYVIVRHEETAVVEHALQQLISSIRVELG